jgi:hypothetical protein
MATVNNESTSNLSEPCKKDQKRIIFALLLFLAASSLITSAIFIKQHLAYKREVMDSTRTHLTSLTFRATRSIDGIVREAIDNVNSVAGQLSGGQLTHEKALIRLRELLEQHPRFLSVALTYRPYAFDPDRRLYSAVYAKKNGLIKYVQLDTIYDYTKPQYDWFGAAISDGPHWSQPLYGEASNSLLVAYSVPFHGTNRTTGTYSVKGVVTVTISMEEIGRIIESLDLGPTGFGALVSQKGVYLYHPDTELVLSRKTLMQVSREQNDRNRMILAEQTGKRGAGILDHRSKTTGLAAWLIYAPIPSTGWSLQNTFIKDDLPWDIKLMRHQLIWITIALVIFLSSAVALLFRAYTGSRTRLWIASTAIAILLAAGIGFLWKISLTYDSLSGNESIRINDKATLIHMTNSFTRASSDRHTEAPVYIPTGIFAESASLNASGDLSLSGYLWQKYQLGTQDAIPRGFTFSGASSMDAQEICRIREKGFEVVRWYFRCTVPQHIDHSKYPLEQENLRLRVLHKDLNHNVFLVPDLAAYKFINPTALPGLRKELNLPGWTITRSFFELRKNVYNTNFGLERPLTKENFPSFCFSIEIKRIFTDAFISNLTSLIIVTILLFTLLMITSRDERLVGFMQAGSGRILNICTAMFFVIAFSHVDIRRKIAAEQVFYLEYFYFLIYLALLWISINSVLYSIGANIQLIQYRQNLVSRLLFWPVLLGLLFIVTVFTFY